jgi:hypothetical protein
VTGYLSFLSVRTESPSDLMVVSGHVSPGPGVLLVGGAWDRHRTGTEGDPRGILSPLRLPIPPPRRHPFIIGIYRHVNRKTVVSEQRTVDSGRRLEIW